MSSQLLKGMISIGRPHGPEPPYIEISVVDDLSGCEFVEVHIPLKEFAELITGLSHVDCEFNFRPALVGKKREHKTERVKYSGGYQREDPRSNPKVIKALAPFEVDGWKGKADDLFNHHRANQDGTYNVLFVRHVDVSMKGQS